MEEYLKYTVVIFLILGFLYGFIQQFRHTADIWKKRHCSGKLYKRELLVNGLCCISYTAFMMSYVVNVLIYAKWMETTYTSNVTGLWCLVFLVLLLGAKLLTRPAAAKRADTFRL